MKICYNCGNEIKKRGNKFCSKSCTAIFSNKNRTRNIKKEKCLNCNKEINKIKKYCSVECSIIHKKNIIFQKIESGDKTLNTKQYKHFLIKKYGNKCMRCEWDKINVTTGKVPIQLEHIDGNSDNNELNNLILLCPNCHSLTPTYGSLNKNGRDSKRKEYRKKWRNENNVGDA